MESKQALIVTKTLKKKVREDCYLLSKHTIRPPKLKQLGAGA